MPNPERTKDLIEAIEISIEKSGYKLSSSQIRHIKLCKEYANINTRLNDEDWFDLCDLFNTVDGRKK